MNLISTQFCFLTFEHVCAPPWGDTANPHFTLNCATRLQVTRESCTTCPHTAPAQYVPSGAACHSALPWLQSKTFSTSLPSLSALSLCTVPHLQFWRPRPGCSLQLSSLPYPPLPRSRTEGVMSNNQPYDSNLYQWWWPCGFLSFNARISLFWNSAECRRKDTAYIQVWIANVFLRNTGTSPTWVGGEGVGPGQKKEANSCFKL